MSGTITAITRAFALLGDPVAHSFSPTIQNAAFAEADVDGVYVDWGTPRERRLERVTPDEIRALSLPSGSMGSKVEAACDFAEATGRPAVIGALDRIDSAVAVLPYFALILIFAGLSAQPA